MMNGFDSSRPESGRVSSGLVGTLLIGIGIVIGVVVASDFGWMPFGHAVPEAPVVKSAPPVPSVAPSVGINGGEQSFVHVAKAVRPAVVSVFSTRTGKGEGPQAMPFDDPFFRRFFGDEFFRRFEQPPQRKELGLGSGVIVEPNGFIVTNNHVVSKADEIKVFLSDKREFKAKLIGTDAKTDIAVLKIEADGLHTIAWADSAATWRESRGRWCAPPTSAPSRIANVCANIATRRWRRWSRTCYRRLQSINRSIWR